MSAHPLDRLAVHLTIRALSPRAPICEKLTVFTKCGLTEPVELFMAETMLRLVRRHPLRNPSGSPPICTLLGAFSPLGGARSRNAVSSLFSHWNRMREAARDIDYPGRDDQIHRLAAKWRGPVLPNLIRLCDMFEADELRASEIAELGQAHASVAPH